MSNERKSLDYVVPEIVLRTASQEDLMWDSQDSFTRRRSYIAVLADYFEQDPPPKPVPKKVRWWHCFSPVRRQESREGFGGVNMHSGPR
jgi:hypothetical protein